jgi:hypothetical protein
MEEIGVQFGVTRERIAKIEDKALRKLRKRLGEDRDCRFRGLTRTAERGVRRSLRASSA